MLSNFCNANNLLPYYYDTLANNGYISKPLKLKFKYIMKSNI